MPTRRASRAASSACARRLASGAWDAKYGHLRALAECDLGYRLVVAPVAIATPCSDSCCRRARSNGRRLQLFEDADLAVVRSSDVDYRASIDDPRVVDVTILRPQEIPRYVADGLFDLGVTGRDWIEETGVDVVTLTRAALLEGDGAPDPHRARGRAATAPWQSVKDLPDGVRVHTEYPELTRRFLEKHGVHAEISLSYGATEAKIPEIADAVVDDHRDRPRAARRGPARRSTRSSSRTPS